MPISVFSSSPSPLYNHSQHLCPFLHLLFITLCSLFVPLYPFARSDSSCKHQNFEQMGFPVGYTDLFFPKLLVHILTFLGLMRKLVHLLLSLVGLGEFLEPEMPLQSRDDSGVCELRSISATLIRELLPVVKFSDLSEAPESCAVCLYEFDDDDEIRRLTNCRHIFHRNCLDRWMDHDQKTCPLCRTPFIPEDMQDAFNERLWLASGVCDFYGEYSPITL